MLTSRAERIDPPQTEATHGMTEPENPHTRGSTAAHSATVVPAPMVLQGPCKKKNYLQQENFGR
jgi:hypothetical protein